MRGQATIARWQAFQQSASSFGGVAPAVANMYASDKDADQTNQRASSQMWTAYQQSDKSHGDEMAQMAESFNQLMDQVIDKEADTKKALVSTMKV